MNATLESRLDTEIARADSELARADVKAATLLQLAGIATAVGPAVLIGAHLPPIAATGGWAAMGCVGAATALLATAVRPNLRGNHGLVHYAQVSRTALLAGLADGESESDKATRLVWTSCAAVRKYKRVRTAVDLLLVAIGVVTVTAVLTVVAALLTTAVTAALIIA